MLLGLPPEGVLNVHNEEGSVNCHKHARVGKAIEGLIVSEDDLRNCSLAGRNFCSFPTGAYNTSLWIGPGEWKRVTWFDVF